MDDIAILGFCDFNVPFARSKESCQALCSGVAALNESNPTKCACLLIFPEIARESSLRGLWDEERQIMEELFSLKQACDHPFVDLYARESQRAELKSNSRKFGSGRVVVSSSGQDRNDWLGSELAVYGRVVGENELESGAPLAVLPRTASILIPEPASPDAVRIADRLRPSAEQLSAQKGPQRLQMILESAMRHTKWKAVLVVNLTGYVEEMSAAVMGLRLKKSLAGEGSNVNLSKVYYLSVHTLDNADNVRYGKNRVARDLLDLWLDGKISYAGISFQGAPGELTEAEKKEVDGAEFLDAPDRMNLQVLVKGADGAFKIHPDQERLWKNIGGSMGEELLGLRLLPAA